MKTENFRMRSTPETVDAALLDLYNPDGARRSFLADNCRKLAAFLVSLPPPQLKMHTFGHDIKQEPTTAECGTQACAFGWACLSGEIAGLGWYAPGDATFPLPVVNGERTEEWGHAAKAFFGQYAWDRIFTGRGTSLKRAAVISLLKSAAKRIEGGYLS